MRPIRQSMWILYGYYNAVMFFGSVSPKVERTRYTYTLPWRPTARDREHLAKKLRKLGEKKPRLYELEYKATKPKRVT